MSTCAVPAKEGVADPEVRIRLLGKKLGLWRFGFDFSRACRQIFGDTDLQNKTILEIGCGKGLFCLWGALQGAREVIGLEPLADGAYDSTSCHQDFVLMSRELGLPQARILPCTIQDYEGDTNAFDLVLSVASINHLDEKNCMRLLDSTEAMEAYQGIFCHVSRLLKPGGKLVVIDAAPRNFFADYGISNPLMNNIDWSKHHQPEVWIALLNNCGFRDARISWISGNFLRHAGIMSLPKTLSYFGRSTFHLEMTRAY
jgi:SAM-dependent methyltransferase